MASWVRNLSASQSKNIFITMLKSPKVSQTNGAEINRNTGRKIKFSPVRTAAPISRERTPPVRTKVGK